MVLRLISNEEEAENPVSWGQENRLCLIVDFSRRQQRCYTLVNITGTEVEKVSCFKYLGVYISEDPTERTRARSLAPETAEEVRGPYSNPKGFFFWCCGKHSDSKHHLLV